MMAFTECILIVIIYITVGNKAAMQRKSKKSF